MANKTNDGYILETQHVTKQFGGLTAVSDLSIHVPYQ
ncbi:MAG: high-affinity branched-chain amino acid ABC transporter ATP-binding protein LivG, partial [Clostridia bacterium]